jgi:hypothetical protein
MNLDTLNTVFGFLNFVVTMDIFLLNQINVQINRVQLETAQLNLAIVMHNQYYYPAVLEELKAIRTALVIS